MALTITPNAVYPLDTWGSVEVRNVNAVPAASDYATGGYTLTPGSGIALQTIYFVLPNGGQGGYVPVWNPATNKLQVFEQAAIAAAPSTASALAEVGAGTDLSALTFSLLVFGR